MFGEMRLPDRTVWVSGRTGRKIQRGGFYALDGTPAVHTPCESSYYYDRFAIFNNGWQSSDSVVDSWEVIRHPCYGTYSLRLFHDESQWFDQREPRLIWVLLSMVLGRPIILTGIEEENKDGRGYPTWYFHNQSQDTRDFSHERNAPLLLLKTTLLKKGSAYAADIDRKTADHAAAIRQAAPVGCHEGLFFCM